MADDRVESTYHPLPLVNTYPPQPGQPPAGQPPIFPSEGAGANPETPEETGKKMAPPKDVFVPPPMEPGAADQLLRMTTGMGLAEWKHRSQTGEFKVEQALSVTDLAANIMKFMTVYSAQKEGVDPKLVPLLGGAAHTLASMLWNPLNAVGGEAAMAKGAREAGLAAKSVAAGERAIPQTAEIAGKGLTPAREVFKLATSPEAKPLREFLEKNPDVVDRLLGFVKKVEGLAERPLTAGVKEPELALAPGVEKAVTRAELENTPAPAPGFTRLYRGESVNPKRPMGPFEFTGEEVYAEGQKKLPQGRFYTTKLEAAKEFAGGGFFDADQERYVSGGVIRYIDIPTEEAEKYLLKMPDYAGFGGASMAPQYIIPHSLGFRRMNWDQHGRVETALAFAMARAALGGATGSFIGNTREEKIRNMLIGMGFGASLSPVLIKKLASLAARQPGRETKLGASARDLGPIETGVGAFRQAVDAPVEVGKRNLGVRWSDLEDPEVLEKTWRKLINLNKEAIEDVKGGVQTEADRKALANALHLTEEDLATRVFHESISPAEIEAAKQLVAEAITRVIATDEALRALPRGSDAWKTTRQEMSRQIGLATILAAKANNMGTVAGRSLRAFQDSAEYAGARDLLAGLREGTLNPEDVAQALRNLNNVGQRANMFTWMFKYGPSLASSAYVSSLLFTGKAWAVKLSSELQASAYMDAERLLQGFFDHAQGLPPYQRVYAAEAHYRVAGQVSAWRDGLDAAWQHLKDGKSMPFAEGGHMTAFDIAAPSAPFPDAIEFLGKIASIPSRPLGADTAFMRVINFQGELYALAAREAYDQLATGKIVKGDWQKTFDALLREPPTWMMSKAKEAAEIATFTDPLVGVMKRLQDVAVDHPSVRFIVPFYKIATNLGRFSWERTPGLGLLARRNMELMSSPSGRSLIAAKQAMGTMTTLAVWELYRQGRIKGRGPINANVRRESDEDIPPYSIRLGGDSKGGGTWYGIDRLAEPMRTPIGWMMDLIQIAGEADPEQWDQAVAATVMAFSENFTSKTFLADVNNFMKAVMDNNPGALRAIEKVGEGMVTSAIAPPGLQQTRRVLDPIKREKPGAVGPGHNMAYKEVSRLLEQLMDRTPGYSKRLWPRVRLDGEDGVYDPFWGQGVIAPLGVVSPVVAKEHRPDAVRQEIVNNKISITLPSNIIFGHKEPPLGEIDWTTGIDLNQNPKWMYRYQKMAGNYLKVRGSNLAGLFEGAEGSDLIMQDIAGDVSGDKFYGMWDLQHVLIKSNMYKEASSGPHGGKSRMMSIIARAFRKAARGVLIDGVESDDIQVPQGWGTGDPILRQLVSEKELEKASSLGGEQMRKELEQSLRDRGMMK